MLSTRFQSLTRKVAAKLTNFLGASNSVINVSSTCELPPATTIELHVGIEVSTNILTAKTLSIDLAFGYGSSSTVKNSNVRIH